MKCETCCGIIYSHKAEVNKFIAKMMQKHNEEKEEWEYEKEKLLQRIDQLEHERECKTCINYENKGVK